MSFLAELNFEGFEIRVLGTPDNPRWVAADICQVLDLSDTSKAVSRLEDYQKGKNIVRTPSGEQEMLTINESGLYSLIFTSRKDEAKRFTRWITDEVIPSIRKTGEYSINQIKPNTDAALIQQYMVTITNRLDQMQLEQQETVRYLQGRLTDAQEIVDEYNQASQEHPGCAGILKDDDNELLTSGEFINIKGIEKRHLRTISKRATTFQRIGKGENPTQKRNGQLLLELRYLKEAAKSVLGLD